MIISIVGLGLIGGSFAKAIKKYTDYTVIGIDTDIKVSDEALASGVIDFIGDNYSLHKSDITIIALYPRETYDFIKSNSRLFKKGSLVLDTCGIKRWICEEINPIAEKKGFNFIGMHPMAGKEKGGFINSDASLFENASLILTPENPENQSLEIIKNLAAKLKFGQTVITTPDEHDNIIAYTSQLPHVLACAYVKDPAALKHRGFSAGSFKDVSRVATINSTLWSQLFIDNKDELTKHISLLINNLSTLNSAIANEDKDELEIILDEARKIKESVE